MEMKMTRTLLVQSRPLNDAKSFATAGLRAVSMMRTITIITITTTSLTRGRGGTG